MYYVLVSFLLSQFNNHTESFDLPSADNDVAWKHGADYTFNVTYITYLQPNSDSPAENNPDQKWGTSLISKLKCRPVQALRMRCHFNCTKFVELTSQTYKTAVEGLLEDVNYRSLDLGEASFEINPEGITNYEFNKKQETDESFQRLYQLITSNLFLSVVDKRFENTSVGDCPVGYEVQKLKQGNPKWNEAFMIKQLHDNEMNETIHLKRQSYLGDCIIQKDYFTANQQIHGFIPADSHIKLESTTNQFSISLQNWTSRTVNTFEVIGPNKAPVGMLYEHYRSQLAQIEPIKRPLKALPNLSTLA
ncbi:uncharacterized protein LOC143352642 [Halictus rubicundus]|uniref:uncharacterized protein LOC143352642 n=1 Tax=Halictus rubicundus TaxID=77578 RepID=UPI0040367EEC